MKVRFQDQAVGYRSSIFEYEPKLPAYAIDPAQPFKMPPDYVEMAERDALEEDILEEVLNAARIIEVVTLHAFIGATGDESRKDTDGDEALSVAPLIMNWATKWDTAKVSVSDCGMKATMPHVDDPSAKFIVEFIPEEVH